METQDIIIIDDYVVLENYLIPFDDIKYIPYEWDEFDSNSKCVWHKHVHTIYGLPNIIKNNRKILGIDYINEIDNKIEEFKKIKLIDDNYDFICYDDTDMDTVYKITHGDEYKSACDIIMNDDSKRTLKCVQLSMEKCKEQLAKFQRKYINYKKKNFGKINIK